MQQTQDTPEFKRVQEAMQDDSLCEDCLGSGKVDQDGCSELEWKALSPFSRIAYDMGMVEFRDCNACGGTGKAVAR